jgi:DNA polymerase III psi subunit
MGDVWFQNIDVTTMSTAQFAALTPDQIHVLSTGQIAELTPDQVHVLSTDQISALTPGQVTALSTADMAALTPDQVHILSTDQISALTPDQVAALSTADISVLSHDQVQHLTLDDVAALHNLGKDEALSAQQVQALIKPHLTNPGLDDVLFSGNVQLHANVVAGSDQLQIIVTGDASGNVQLVDHGGHDWKDAGTLLVPGAHVYTNGHTQIVVQGSVTAIEKDLSNS